MIELTCHCRPDIGYLCPLHSSASSDDTRLSALSPASVGAGEPVAWMYSYPGAYPSVHLERLHYETTWTETPLYASPATPAKQAEQGGEEKLREALEPLPDDLARATAIGWIDNNFGALSGKPNATERLITCFMAGLQISWDNVIAALRTPTHEGEKP